MVFARIPISSGAGIRNPPIIAYTIPIKPKTASFPEQCIITFDITPKAGKIRIYTSGCPKNQNKC